MLVSRVIGDCPKCGGAASFGNVSINGDHLLRGCSRCDHEALLWLPPIRKKILYLDQFFFSGAFRGGDDRIFKAVTRIKRVAHLQLLVAPYSSVHEDETDQWRGHKGMGNEQLMEFIKLTSGGAEFEKDYKVERTQILKAWHAYLDKKSADYSVERKEAVRGEFDRWNDYFFVDVGRYLGDVEVKRSLKLQAVDELIGILDDWRNSTQTFEQDVALENKDAGRTYVRSYLEKIKRLARGDLDAAIDSPIISTVVEQMFHCLPKKQPFDERLCLCADFFGSAHFENVPVTWLRSRMFATLKHLVKGGAYANREVAKRKLNGVFSDIRHIAFYAPYCDAFVMDTPMADLVRQPTVRLEDRYGIRVFSLNNWDKLLDWLDELEAGMTDEHKQGVARAYP